MAKLFYRSVGLELMGVKNNKSCTAVLDYFPKTERLALTEVESAHPKSEKELAPGSAEEDIVRSMLSLRQEATKFCGIGVHAPLSLPPYLQNPGKKWPFPEKSKDPQVKWMNALYEKLEDKPRPFVPYLQRPAELWLRHLCPEKFPISDGFGANGAPLAARMQFLKSYLPQPLNEVFPRATMSRLATSLSLPKWMITDYADLEKGLRTREAFLEQLLEKLPHLLIYNKDVETLVLNLHAFHAFLSAFTQFLIFKEFCERPPRDFPKAASWIHIPRVYISWDKIFREK